MLVGVIVMVGVIVGVREGVGVGPVAVGKGPYSACDVRAIDVRVLFARAKSSSPETDGWMSAKI